MERIQTAIQKARETRQKSNASLDSQTNLTQKITSQVNQEVQDTADSIKDKLWSNLPQMTLNQKQLRKARIVADKVEDGSASFDVIRTRMIHQMQTNNWRRVAITSPGPGCGKTTLCLNLAFSFARQRNIKTMTIELDMRRPNIEQILKQKGQRNFADSLEGNSPAEEHMLCYKHKLAFATNRRSVQNPAEILQDKIAADVVDHLEEQFKPDFMLFDTPPMLACDDTYTFLDQIDCVLLVAAAGSTTAEELEKCENEISSRCNYLGVVLNKCQYLDSTDTYGY